MTGEAQSAGACRLAVAVLLAGVDGRDQDLPELLAGADRDTLAVAVRGLALAVGDLHDLLTDADRDTLAIAVGGLALAVGLVLGEVPAERRAAIREQLSAWALNLAGRPE